MAAEKSRLVRLTKITTQLQSKRLITAREIADKYGISIRTVYRDIKTLEESGIPITVEEGKGYRLVEGFTLPPVAFSEEEANALITAEQIILRNKDYSLTEQYRSALIKIKSVLKQTQKEKVELLEDRLQIRNNPENEKSSSLLMNLQLALTNFQVVQLNYRSLQGHESMRNIEPFAIFSTQENWVLIAHCRLRNEFRSFRLDCIQSMTLTGEVFEPHTMSLEEYLTKCRETWDTPDIPLA